MAAGVTMQVLLGLKQSSAALTLSFIASATSTTTNITIPASAAIGDFAVLITDGFGGAESTVTPTGWTNVAAATATGSVTGNKQMDYKILVSGDPGLSIAGMNAATDVKTMLVFRPSQTLVSTTPFGGSVVRSIGDPALITGTVTAEALPIIMVGSVASSTATTGISGTLPTNGTLVTNTGLQSTYYEIQSSPTSRTIDSGDGGSNANNIGGFTFT